MTILSAGNLLIYSAQVLLVVVAATIGARIVGLSAPRPRLAFWRAVVAACVLLPLWPARVDMAAPSSPIVGVETVDPLSGASDPSPSSRRSLLAWLVLSGAAVRGAWLGFGLLRLRQLRARSKAGTLDGSIEALKRAVAPRADLRWDDHIDQPLTFGFWRPIVLLPRRLSDLSPEAQRAVVCHELLHVSRHDWAWTLVEEAVQTAFWFHPAMWWALGQVQLSREETVDELVVAMTGTRRDYMNALMIFANARPALASVIPYVRRRHLASRIRHLSQETVMSPARLALTGAALVIVILGSSAGVVSTLPLHANAPAPAPATGQAKAVAGPRLKAATNEPINLAFKDTPLTVILGFIGRASGITVTYEKGFVDVPKVSVDVKDATLEEALNQILTPNRLSYKVINERSILVGPVKHAEVQLFDPQDEGVSLPQVVKEIGATYTPEAMNARIEGTMTVAAIVNADGTVGDVRVTRSLEPSYGLDEEAMKAARQWRFRPGTKDGKPVAVRVSLQFRFTLK